MSRNRLPWYRREPHDWVNSEARKLLPLDAQGAVANLIEHAMTMSPPRLPETPEAARRFSEMGRRRWRRFGDDVLQLAAYFVNQFHREQLAASNRAKKAIEIRYERIRAYNDRSTTVLLRTETETKTEEDTPPTPPKPARSARLKAPKVDPFEAWLHDVFEPAYPSHRRVQHKTALSELRKRRPSAEERAAYLARLTLWKRSDAWLKDDGQFVVGMGRFFADGYCERDPEAGGHQPPYLRPFVAAERPA